MVLAGFMIGRKYTRDFKWLSIALKAVTIL